MSKSYTVSSLPLKDVIKNLAEGFNTSYSEKCSEYMVSIPQPIGSGEIRGINFDNGLGMILYRCKFAQDTQIEFTVNEVHPVKYIYTSEGLLSHKFSDESVIHHIDANKCAIVASHQHNGHILYFQKDQKTDVVSLEIDRERFTKGTECQLVYLSDELQELFRDVGANKTFYHDGFYSLDFRKIIETIDDFKDELLIRKFHLESNALNIFVKQIQLFEDDTKNDSSKRILRYNELERIKALSSKIDVNLGESLSIEELSRESGLNPSKLQAGFKYIYNKTVRDYIISKRLEKSQSLLATTDLSMKSISAIVGMESPSYFSKLFKENFKITPTEFRKLAILNLESYRNNTD